MAEPASDLLQAFREDHAKLGAGFHALSRCFRTVDFDGAQRVVRALDREAGAHIASEEEAFYPRIAALLDRDGAAQVLAEHREDLAAVVRLCAEQAKAPLATQAQERHLAQSECLESHIAECGKRFEAIGRIPAPEQGALYDALIARRKRAPTWRGYLSERTKARSTLEAPG